MKINQATKEDVKRFAPLMQTWASEMGYDLTDKEILDYLLEKVESGVILFIEHNGEILGLLSAVACEHFWLKEVAVHEDWFFVNPKHRNKKIGDALQQALCNWAKARKCKAVIITPNKFGSVNPKIVADSLERRGYSVHGYSMRKEL